MPANDLIKTLPDQKHTIFIQQLNLVDISDKLVSIKKENYENDK